jgi:hypothetical protein
MIFIDSGAWVALTIPNDKNASRARALYSEVQQGRHGSLVTTDFILDEVLALVRMAVDAPTAVRFAEAALSSKSVSILRIDPARFREALRMLGQNAVRRWTFTDCTSFVVMRGLGITKAFTFDPGFEQAGYECLP